MIRSGEKSCLFFNDQHFGKLGQENQPITVLLPTVVADSKDIYHTEYSLALRTHEMTKLKNEVFRK